MYFIFTSLIFRIFFFQGPVAMSTTCKLIAPGVAINGLMSITKTDLYYEMDEEDAENKKIDPEVSVVVMVMVSLSNPQVQSNLGYRPPLNRYLVEKAQSRPKSARAKFVRIVSSYICFVHIWLSMAY